MNFNDNYLILGENTKVMTKQLYGIKYKCI